MPEDILDVDKNVLDRMVNMEQVHRCSRCRGSTQVKPRHCYIKQDGTPMIICNDKDCQCKCRTHYVCKDCGALAPYDQTVKHVCLSLKAKLPTPKLTKKDKELNKELEAMMDKWRSSQVQEEITYKEKKK